MCSMNAEFSRDMRLPATIYSPFRRGRTDWNAIREHVDLARVAIALLGSPPGRQGEGGKRLWWHCPFHEDQNPSFCVEPGKPWWKCFGCGEHGDAITLVRKIKGIDFPSAVNFITDLQGIKGVSGVHAPFLVRKAPGRSQEEPTGLPLSNPVPRGKLRREPLGASGG